jgi:CRISPR/Cas system-associated exonuclease Cas4 (RecB family)
LLQEYTIEELFVEYMEDVIEREPMQAYSPRAVAAGEVFESSADAAADALLQQAHEGVAIDPLALIHPDDRARVAKWLKTKEKGTITPAPAPAPAPAEFPEFTDTYKEDPNVE